MMKVCILLLHRYEIDRTVVDLQDTVLLAKLAAGDMVALEASIMRAA